MFSLKEAIISIPQNPKSLADNKLEQADGELRPIEFDWGDSGEPDGFDAWRLWHFYQANGIAFDCESASQVRSWLEEAVLLGELTKDRLLYYSPANRS